MHAYIHTHTHTHTYTSYMYISLGRGWGLAWRRCHLRGRSHQEAPHHEPSCVCLRPFCLPRPCNLSRRGHICSKVLSLGPWHSQCSLTLSFQNFCQPAPKMPRTKMTRTKMTRTKMTPTSGQCRRRKFLTIVSISASLLCPSPPPPPPHHHHQRRQRW